MPKRRLPAARRGPLSNRGKGCIHERHIYPSRAGRQSVESASRKLNPTVADSAHPPSRRRFGGLALRSVFAKAGLHATLAGNVLTPVAREVFACAACSLQLSSPAQPQHPSPRRAPTATTTRPPGFTWRRRMTSPSAAASGRATPLCCISIPPAVIRAASRVSPRLCGLYFKAVPSAETQQWLNSRWKDEALLAEVRRLFERIMQVKSEETFTLRDENGGDVVGLEFVGPSRQNPDGRSDDVAGQHAARPLADDLPAAVGSGREGVVCPARHPGHDQAAEMNRRRRQSEETSPCAALFP